MALLYALEGLGPLDFIFTISSVMSFALICSSLILSATIFLMFVERDFSGASTASATVTDVALFYLRADPSAAAAFSARRATSWIGEAASAWG